MFEHQLASIGARHLDPVQGSEIIGVRHHCPFGVRLGEAFKAEFHILGGHFAVAVVEHLAGVQFKLDFRVGILLDPFRRIRLPLQHTGFEPRQTLTDGTKNVVLYRTDAIGGVQVADVDGEADGDGITVRRMGRGETQHKGGGGGSGGAQNELAAGGVRDHGDFLFRMGEAFCGCRA